MENHIKILVKNQKAFYNYFLEDFLECGIELMGTEIKSLRHNGASLGDAYIIIRSGQAYILNMSIAPYQSGNLFNHEPTRTRRLLLHKLQLQKMGQKAAEKSLSIVPVKLYLKNGKAKLEIALAKPKKKYDKREVMRQKDDERMMARAKKNFNQGED